MSALVRKPSGRGYLMVASPQSSDLQLLEFGLLRLKRNEEFTGHALQELGEATHAMSAEVALLVLSGTCTFKVEGQEWQHVGGRRDVFSGKAATLYVPPKLTYTVIAETNVEIAVVKAIADGDGEPTLIPPEQVKSRTVGYLNWQRQIDDVIDASFPAKRLLLGETRNPPGNWSSYPPHKHDVDNPPQEVKLEEVYHYRIMPSNGFAIQRLYTDDGAVDETYVICDGDTLVITRGYHPIVAAPGYQLYYLWALAGDVRQMLPKFEEQHSWILGMEAVLGSQQ